MFSLTDFKKRKKITAVRRRFHSNPVCGGYHLEIGCYGVRERLCEESDLLYAIKDLFHSNLGFLHKARAPQSPGKTK